MDMFFSCNIIAHLSNTLLLGSFLARICRNYLKTGSYSAKDIAQAGLNYLVIGG